MTKKVYDRIEARFEGKLVRVTVEHYSRGGLLSPTLEVIVYKGKKYFPRHDKKPNLTFSGLFSMIYGNLIKEIVSCNQSSTFLDLVKKDRGYSGYYHVPIILQKGVHYE